MGNCSSLSSILIFVFGRVRVAQLIEDENAAGIFLRRIQNVRTVDSTVFATVRMDTFQCEWLKSMF